MATCKPMSTPMATNEKLQQLNDSEKVDVSLFRSLVGSLIYLTYTRPDIAFAISVVSRYMNDPRKNHFAAAKRILRYLQETRKLGVLYGKENDCNLVGYVDSDWAGSIDDRKSTTGYIFCRGKSPISWCSRKQRTVALSSTEAEYSTITEAACE
ncbi:secreted RxLR effector protein 161-like [Andrographis paniculata]|uniref:secreted RxLR effector protein 161-like n=1 Tax=Andrographis paniculata TaxID=175694 RepID=UPI0021E980CF|nr:secreted RxLR effector protein 161-like [Andrographis paniculata]